MADNQDSDSEVNFNLNVNNRQAVEEDDRGDMGDHDYDIRARMGRDPDLPRKAAPRIKPDPFTGEEDWDQYISYFEECAELCQWSDREKMLYLATSLKQQARVHYSSLPQEEKNSYRVLIFSLGQRFGGRRQQSRWISKLQNKTRDKSEAIGAFGDEIRLYSQKAYLTLDQEAQEMLALQQFYKNVSPEMRVRLMDRDCRTVREAVEIVERYEEVIGRTDVNARSQVRSVSRAASSEFSSGKYNDVSKVERGGPEDEFDGIKGSLRKIEERLQKLETKGEPKNRNFREYPTRNYSRTCYECGSGDHLYRECPERKQNGWKSSGNQGNARPSHQ